MDTGVFTESEREKIIDYFGKQPDELLLDEIDQRQRELRVKFHPDKFEKFSDETVKLLAAEKYKEIEFLSDKVRNYLKNRVLLNSVALTNSVASEKYAYNRLKIEIITKEKDLKYYLFGTHYRWLERGDKFRIKGTNAFIVIDANYSNRSIGFTESIKMYLTFTVTDSLDIIIGWLFLQINGNATKLLIEGTPVPVEFSALLTAIKVKTVLRLEA